VKFKVAVEGEGGAEGGRDGGREEKREGSGDGEEKEEKGVNAVKRKAMRRLNESRGSFGGRSVEANIFYSCLLSLRAQANEAGNGKGSFDSPQPAPITLQRVLLYTRTVGPVALGRTRSHPCV
jgi:hypothetical protein